MSRVGVIGFGRVGRSLSQVLSRHYEVVGYDPDVSLRSDFCPLVHEGGDGLLRGLEYYIVCAPTPLDAAGRPDTGPLECACRQVGEVMGAGACVVVESSVYPGCTEVLCRSVLERVSGLRLDSGPDDSGRGFRLAYSPERLNPGDELHSLDRVVKLVAANDAETLRRAVALYAVALTTQSVQGIRVAEAAKLLENVQRDVNIALVNEFTRALAALDVPVAEVLAAAATKWNFHTYHPGLVGGACLPANGPWLLHACRAAGVEMPLVRCARGVNEGQAAWVAGRVDSEVERRGLRCRGVAVHAEAYKPELSGEAEADLTRRLLRPLVEQLARRGFEPLSADDRRAGIHILVHGPLERCPDEVRQRAALLYAVEADDFFPAS